LEKMEIRSNLGWKYGTLLIVDGVLVSNGSLYHIDGEFFYKIIVLKSYIHIMICFHLILTREGSCGTIIKAVSQNVFDSIMDRCIFCFYNFLESHSFGTAY